MPITVEKANFNKEGNQTGTEQVTVTQDEGIRGGTTAEILSGLRTVFKDGIVIREGKDITAGNASQLSDGAAARILMERRAAEAEGKEILGIYRGFQVAGCEPDVGDRPGVRDPEAAQARRTERRRNRPVGD